jgi:hypothetical protein
MALTKNKFKSVYTQLNPETYIRGKVYCEMNGLKFYELLNEALEEYLNNRNFELTLQNLKQEEKE